MRSCKLIIKDEVNIKLEGLELEARRKLANAFKYELPYARHHPAFKLGRWDGTVSLFGIGGNGYLSQLEQIMSILSDMKIEIGDIEDLRKSVKLKFDAVTETYWADQGKVWPKGHIAEGQPIMLRDYQVDAVNTFLENPQSLQEIATGAGKTITTATLSQLCEPYGRTITIVPNKSLVEQTEENQEHDILTLAEFLDGVAAVIVDEVHMAKADVLKALLTQNLSNAPIRWGLTGTVPKEKFEYEQIFASIGPVVGGIAAHELQDRGVLSQCHVNIVQMIDIPEFKMYQEELKYLVTDEDRMRYIGALVKQISQTGNTLVLVNRIDSGKFLINEIEDSVFISGEVKTTTRKEEYDEVKTSTNKVIVATYGVAAVGINIPRIFNLVLLESGKSFTRVIQSIGRGIRKAEDKDFVQIWDITSTCKFAKRHLTQRKKFYKDAKYPFTLDKVDWSK